MGLYVWRCDFGSLGRRLYRYVIDDEITLDWVDLDKPCSLQKEMNLILWV